jgi:hypothetical protein
MTWHMMSGRDAAAVALWAEVVAVVGAAVEAVVVGADDGVLFAAVADDVVRAGQQTALALPW